MRIVVAGGTGLLGAALVRVLAAEGHDVVVLTRGRARPRHVTWVPDGSTGAWAASLDGADAVVNLAGAAIADRRWTEARKRELRESRVLATRSLARAILETRAHPPVFVSMSGVGYYGPRGNEAIDESATAGTDFFGVLAVGWESAARVAEEAGVRVVLLRTGVVLAREGGALPKMALPFRLGVGGPLGHGRQYLPWIHLADWIALARWTLATPAAAGPLNATAPDAVTNETFARTLARVLRRPHALRAPAFALRLALGEMADVLLTGQRAVPARALELGYRFRFPELEPALRDLLA